MQPVEGDFDNQGEVCTTGSRLFVEEKRYDECIERSMARAKRSIVGDPFDPRTDQGPQVDKSQFQKVMSYIDSGKQEGAQLLCGGRSWLLRRADGPCGGSGPDEDLLGTRFLVLS